MAFMLFMVTKEQVTSASFYSSKMLKHGPLRTKCTPFPGEQATLPNGTHSTLLLEGGLLQDAQPARCQGLLLV